MSEIRLNIDGREAVGFEGQTILDIARGCGVDIPTLCHDDRVEMFGSCGICVVEAEGNPKLIRACSTFAADGMVISTNTDRVRQTRKAALELLLSDHTGDCRPPCVLACPAETDCQGYVGMIANGQYDEALALVKDKVPLPASIGRVCPHPCEDACRREMVEEPVAIASLKQFVGDLSIAQGKMYTAQVGQPTGKHVAIVGGGPGGLSAAYFLRTQGHEVTVYDAMPQMGGMLRYGIPEYRLPKKILDAEIAAIEQMGAKLVPNMKIGRDLTLSHLRDTCDAVVVAVGAWHSTPLGCPGEELEGVFGGIDFLRDVAMNNPVFTGRKVAIVGGGNTAMDACRTAVRLGASEVYNIYRRTRNEMPAQQIEIIEAEEEGVIFKNLTNPIEVLGENGKVKAVRLQIMELGEPDDSGRRRPVPVAGKEETIEIDCMIAAIGQKPNLAGFEELDNTRWGTIIADESSFLTNMEGVFAIGDVTNNGADIAIAAIGEAGKAAEMVGRYLSGEALTCQEPYLVKSEKTAEDFAGKEKMQRAGMPHRAPDVRRKDFLEVNLGYGECQAKDEAARCLECGCQDFFECKLIKLADKYAVQPEKYEGKVNCNPSEDDHPFIARDPDKCILCGLCVRICDEVVGAAALGFVGRGFDTLVSPALNTDLRDTDCVCCGQCVHVCPTGALTEKIPAKQVPMAESFVETTCSFCSVGCGTKMAVKGSLLTRSLPADEKGALLCAKGRFGFGEITKKPRLSTPLICGENGMSEISFEQAVVYANKSLQSLQSQFGDDCVAVSISDRYTNEEAFLIKEYASKALRTSKVFSLGKVESGLADVLGRDAGTASLDELENTKLIVAVAPEGIVKNHGVAAMRIRRAVSRGAKLLLISCQESLLDDIADRTIDTGNDLQVLKGIVKALSQSDKAKGIEGYDQLLASLQDIAVSQEAGACADMIAKAPKAVFIFEKNALTVGAARLIANMALLSGRHWGPRNGVVQLLPGANSQGLSDLGILPGEDMIRAISEKEIRGLFIFGEDVGGADLSDLDFLAVQDLHMTGTAEQANVVFPGCAPTETAGTFTGADGKIRQLKPVVTCSCDNDTLAQIKALTAHAGLKVGRQSNDLQRTACCDKTKARLVPVDESALYRESLNTNTLCASFMDFMAAEL